MIKTSKSITPKSRGFLACPPSDRPTNRPTVCPYRSASASGVTFHRVKREESGKRKEEEEEEEEENEVLERGKEEAAYKTIWVSLPMYIIRGPLLLLLH